MVIKGQKTLQKNKLPCDGVLRKHEKLLGRELSRKFAGVNDQILYIEVYFDKLRLVLCVPQLVSFLHSLNHPASKLTQSMHFKKASPKKTHISNGMLLGGLVPRQMIRQTWYTVHLILCYDTPQTHLLCM